MLIPEDVVSICKEAWTSLRRSHDFMKNRGLVGERLERMLALSKKIHNKHAADSLQQEYRESTGRVFTPGSHKFLI